MTESVILVVLILLIGVPVLGYLVSNNLLKPPIQRPATRIWKSIKFVFYLLLGVGIAFAVFEKMADSGWVPRAREVLVYVHVRNWATGEIKACVSLAKVQRNELEITRLRLCEGRYIP